MPACRLPLQCHMPAEWTHAIAPASLLSSAASVSRPTPLDPGTPCAAAAGAGARCAVRRPHVTARRAGWRSKATARAAHVRACQHGAFAGNWHRRGSYHDSSKRACMPGQRPRPAPCMYAAADAQPQLNSVLVTGSFLSTLPTINPVSLGILGSRIKKNLIHFIGLDFVFV